MDSRYRKFWNTCKPDFSHITNTRTVSNPKVLEKYENLFLKLVDFTDKSIIDFGCGNGDLDKYLFENKGIKSAHLFDIPDRSLAAAKDNLGGKPVKYTLIKDIDSVNFNADILVSLACVQHFPDYNYLAGFIRAINKSNLKTLILQIRYCDYCFDFFDKPYRGFESVRLACRVNDKWLESMLKNFVLVRRSGIMHNNYLYLVFQK